MSERIRAIQAHIGVEMDGMIGPRTLAAIEKAIGMNAETGRKISPKGIALIKSFEGLELKAYPDPATGGAPWTIGCGHAGPEVRPGLVITEAQADALLAADLGRFERAVNKACPRTTQNQFDAMVALCFNIGERAFGASTLVKRHNDQDHAAAAKCFNDWVFAAGKRMNGLVRRRAAEAVLYRGDD